MKFKKFVNPRNERRVSGITDKRLGLKEVVTFLKIPADSNNSFVKIEPRRAQLSSLLLTKIWINFIYLRRGSRKTSWRPLPFSLSLSLSRFFCSKTFQEFQSHFCRLFQRHAVLLQIVLRVSRTRSNVRCGRIGF